MAAAPAVSVFRPPSRAVEGEDRHRRLLELERKINGGSVALSSSTGSRVPSSVPSEAPVPTPPREPPPQRRVHRLLKTPTTCRSAVSSACSTRSRSSAAGSGSHQSRPSTVPSASASGAASQSAGSQSGRSQSSDGTRPGSHGSHSARVAAQDFSVLCETVAAKAALRYSTVTRVFHLLDADCSGFIEQGDVLNFFRLFNLREEDARRFFAGLDGAGSGRVGFEQFRRTLGEYIKPGFGRTEQSSASEASKPNTPRRPQCALTLQQLCDVMAEKAYQRPQALRFAFRLLCDDKDNLVRREECLNFIEAVGFPRAAGHHIFDLLTDQSGQNTGTDTLSLNYVKDLFGPFVLPGYRPNLVQSSKPGSAKTSTRPSTAGSSRASAQEDPIACVGQKMTVSFPERAKNMRAGSAKSSNVSKSTRVSSTYAPSESVPSVSSRPLYARERPNSAPAYSVPQRPLSARPYRAGDARIDPRSRTRGDTFLRHAASASAPEGWTGPLIITTPRVPEPKKKRPQSAKGSTPRVGMFGTTATRSAPNFRAATLRRSQSAMRAPPSSREEVLSRASLVDVRSTQMSGDGPMRRAKSAGPTMSTRRDGGYGVSHLGDAVYIENMRVTGSASQALSSDAPAWQRWNP